MNLRRRSKISAEFSMASMTDIVFLLLIFFMLASTLVTSSALDLILPNSHAQSVKKQDVTVNISPDQRFSVGATILPQEQVENEVLKRIQGMEDPVLILRADKSVPYEKVVFVMDLAYRNKIKMIAATDPADN